MQINVDKVKTRLIHKKIATFTLDSRDIYETYPKVSLWLNADLCLKITSTQTDTF